MRTDTAPGAMGSPSGLRFEFHRNGAPRRIACGDVMINLFPGNGLEPSPCNIYLRRFGAERAVATPLLGPDSQSSYDFASASFGAAGRWDDLAYAVRLVPAAEATAWFWHVEVTNCGERAAECDLIFAQDVALAPESAVRMNEYYVSQYVDHTPLLHAACGAVVASRQNQSVGGRFPWLAVGSLGKSVAFSTDALQFYGLCARAAGEPPALQRGLPGARLQHEHSMACVQDEPFRLAPGETARRGFFAYFVGDHPAATSDADLSAVDAALSLPEAAARPAVREFAAAACPSLFAPLATLTALDLREDEAAPLFGAGVKQAERDGGRLLSFFTGRGTHVALKAKELDILRPHGQILRTNTGLVPDEAALTSTAWMGGTFASMVTQGHVSINRFLSTAHGYLGFLRADGLRIFAEYDGRWLLLDVPSAFEMGHRYCRWIYRHARGLIEVRCEARADRIALAIAVLEGKPTRFLVSQCVAITGEGGAAPRIEWTAGGADVYADPDTDVGRRFPHGYFRVTAEPLQEFGRDELLFLDGVSRELPFLTLVTAPCRAAELAIEGHLVAPDTAATGKTRELAARLEIDAPDKAARLGEILPWFADNALVHYLSPRGLEQYSGGGWGTRDVCQGPVELLLALGKPEAVRDILLKVYRQQNEDGDWPQWFMFFERERDIRPVDSHGDIVYWPVLALAEYLEATGDASILREEMPFFAGATNHTVGEHVERALDLMRRRVIPGTHLPAYGHGDWNDSLQPVKPEMRENLCSAWTATLAYQTLTSLARAFRTIGETSRAGKLGAWAERVLGDFQRLLVSDGVVAGLAWFHGGEKPELLIHPSDKLTGLSYGVLPMVHAIAHGMFTPEQAEKHLGLIREHLRGPDGARLFDRPIAYHGGPAELFQRAETASFFGREIGLMYTHAHLRYCEALARHGDAEELFRALSQANPIAVRETVPPAARRQANCYYSSSDAAFGDRYVAEEEYGRSLAGDVPLEGGWRVYSSGPGIAARLILRDFLGLRREAGRVVIDPVIAPSLGTFEAKTHFGTHDFAVRYRPGKLGYGPASIELNGCALKFSREENPYRTGGARIAEADWEAALQDGGNRLEIALS